MNEKKDVNPMRDLRLALGLTQVAMGVRLRCSTKTVRCCEYERRLPRMLGVRADFLALQGEVAGGNAVG